MNIHINNYEFYPNKKEVGKKIKFYRKQIGVTASQLADMLGYDTKTINKWEQGRGFPSDQNLVNLSEIFQCTVDDLLFVNNKCLTDYRIDYLVRSYTHSLYKNFWDQILDSNYFQYKDLFDFKSANNYLIRQDYILQKYIKSYLTNEEYKELYFILNNRDSEDEIHVEFNMLNQSFIILDNIQRDYKNGTIKNIDDALFELRKLYITSYEMNNLFVALYRYSILDEKTYWYILKNLTLYEKDLFLNLIMKNNLNDFNKMADDLFSLGARVNNCYPKLNVNYDKTNCKEFLSKYKNSKFIKNCSRYLDDYNDWKFFFDEDKIIQLTKLYRRLDICYMIQEYSKIIKNIECESYKCSQISNCFNK